MEKSFGIAHVLASLELRFFQYTDGAMGRVPRLGRGTAAALCSAVVSWSRQTKALGSSMMRKGRQHSFHSKPFQQPASR